MPRSMTEQEKRMLEYGRKRELQRLKRIRRDEEIIVSEIQGIIRNALDDIEQEANSWYLKYMEDTGLTLAEAKKVVRLKDIRFLEQKAKEYVDRWYDEDFAFSPEANAQMKRYNFGMRMNRLELLQCEMALALDDAAVESENLIGAYLTYSSIVELRRQAGLLGQSVPPSSSLLKRARVIANASFQDETFSSRIWNNQEELKKRLFKGIRQSIIQGKNPLTWSNSLKDLLEDVGNLANYCTARIAITESARCQMEAQRQSYLENGYTQYMVICEPTACDICKKFDGVVQDVKDWVQGENAPAFHPFCKCSTTSYMDRRELEQSFAELEKAAGMPEEDRFQNIYDSVVRHRKDLIRNDLPEGFFMQETESSGRAVQLLEETIKRLNAKTDIPSEIGRARRYSKNWLKADLDALVEAWGVDFSSAEMSKNGKKINLDTNREHVKIVVSPSGKYFRIWDDRFKHNNQDGYFDIQGDRGEELRKKINQEYGDEAELLDIEGIIKERTHFRYD